MLYCERLKVTLCIGNGKECPQRDMVCVWLKDEYVVIFRDAYSNGNKKVREFFESPDFK
jgi:hypothetical protein